MWVLVVQRLVLTTISGASCPDADRNQPGRARRPSARLTWTYLRPPTPSPPSSKTLLRFRWNQMQTRSLLNARPHLACKRPKAIALAHSLVLFRAEGGTGAWRFRLTQNESGAILNELTGAYLAGNLGDPSRAEFGSPMRDASAPSNWKFALSVAWWWNPPTRRVLPGETIQFDVAEGSGDFILEMRRDRSGAQIDAEALEYVAGEDLDGDGLVEVRCRVRPKRS